MQCPSASATGSVFCENQILRKHHVDGCILWAGLTLDGILSAGVDGLISKCNYCTIISRNEEFHFGNSFGYFCT